MVTDVDDETRWRTQTVMADVDDGRRRYQRLMLITDAGDDR